jgi:hypothetical protein
MKITLEGLTADELLKIAKVLTDEPVVSVKQTESVESIESVKSVNNVLTLDKEGLPWDERIHSSNHQMTAKGVWQRRRGITDEEYNRVKTELLAPITLSPIEDPAPVAPVTSVESIIPYASAPVAPQAPVAPAEPIVPQAPAAPAAPVAPAYDFVNNATAPVESIMPQAAPVAEDPEALYNRMFEQLRNGLQMKVLDANFMQNVIAGVNATFGTSYQGAAELRGNAQALSYVINELVKKGL